MIHKMGQHSGTSYPHDHATSRNHFQARIMEKELIVSPGPDIQVHAGSQPHHNPGAWIFLLAVFMSGMLFQACVPRLCQKGVQVGGSCLKRAKDCWRWLETAAAKTMRERSPRHSTRQRSLSGIRDPGTP